MEGERQGSEEGIPTYESGSGTLPGGTPWYSYTPIGDVGGEGIDWVDTALDVVTYGLIGMDLLLGGPTGEGIVPAMAIGTFRLGGRQAAKQAAKEAFRKEAGDLPKRVLRETREGGSRRIKGVGAGRANYRPKLDGRYSVTPQSGRSKDTLHFQP